MFAIVQTGGKQYRIEKGAKLQVEKLPQEAGSSIELSEVLLVGGNGDEPKIGRPTVPGTKVTATVLRHVRAPKVIIFKKRSKKGYKKIQGHRQDLTEIEVRDIQVG